MTEKRLPACYPLWETLITQKNVAFLAQPFAYFAVKLFLPQSAQRIAQRPQSNDSYRFRLKEEAKNDF